MGLALALYNEAADAGDGLGVNNVAVAKILGLGGGEPDYKVGLAMLRRAAEMGIADAFFSLGDLHSRGKGVEQDLDQGRLYMVKATELGSASAMIYMAQIYLRGTGVVADPSKAEEWYRKAIDHGSVDAMLQLAGLHSRDESKHAEAHALVRRAAGKGSVKGQHQLGILHLNGIGVEKDPVKARQLFSNAADRGSPDAMFMMAKLLQSGTGGIQNQESSVTMLKKAADAGQPVACRSMAEAYFTGQLFGKKDLDEALDWFRKAAQGNDLRSQLALANILVQYIGKNMGEEGNDKKAYEAFKWAEIAANRGDVNGMKLAASIAPLVGTFKVSEALEKHEEKDDEDNYVTLDNGQKIYVEPLSPSHGIHERYEAIAAKWREKAASAGDPEGGYMMAKEQYDTLFNDYLFVTGISGGRKSAGDLSKEFREEALTAVSAAEGALKPMLDLEKVPPQGLVLKGQLLEARMLLMERSDARSEVAQKVYDTLFESADQGYPEGMAELARTLEFRFGKPDSAYKWRIKAGEAGHADSLIWLGRHHIDEGEWAEAQGWFAKAKARGESVDRYLEFIDQKLSGN